MIIESAQAVHRLQACGRGLRDEQLALVGMLQWPAADVYQRLIASRLDLTTGRLEGIRQAIQVLEEAG